jgi:hypothetical protein
MNLRQITVTLELHFDTEEDYKRNIREAREFGCGTWGRFILVKVFLYMAKYPTPHHESIYCFLAQGSDIGNHTQCILYGVTFRG